MRPPRANRCGIYRDRPVAGGGAGCHHAVAVRHPLEEKELTRQVFEAIRMQRSAKRLMMRERSKAHRCGILTVIQAMEHQGHPACSAVLLACRIRASVSL